MKAIICMDGVESKVGKSEGGTGKTIWGTQFEHIFPIEIIDGQQKNIEDDNHLYESVDERTKAIVYDDVRVNFNFNFLKSQITTGLKINQKGVQRFRVLPPKFIIITNHMLKGEGNSVTRRQYNLSFSDYFNGHRTVGDHFGHQLFHEWDYEQWNLYYNWIATCIQHYLKFKLEYTIPSDMINRRKLRQSIGENLITWASLVFDVEEDSSGDWGGVFLNKKVEKGYLLDKYLKMYPRDARYIDSSSLKEKLIKYAEYTGLDFNGPKNGDRIKSNSKEYILLSNDKYTQQMFNPPINDDQTLIEWGRRNEDQMPSYKAFEGIEEEEKRTE